MGLKITTEMNTKHDKEKQPIIPIYLLSKEFRSWYADLIGEGVLSSWDGHPHFYFHPDFAPTSALKNAGLKPKKIVQIDELKDIDIQTDYFLPSGHVIQEKLKPFVKGSLTQYLKHMPPITSADLIQNTEKVSRLLTLDFREWLVVVEVKNPETIASNLKILDGLTSEFNAQAKGELDLGVLKDWILVGESGHHFLISPFIGSTLEQTFKETKVEPRFRRKILMTLRRFASFCEERGIFWRDLAPRNILIPKGSQNQLIFIDYEHLYKTADLSSQKRRSLGINRKIWFGDILEQDKIDNLFGVADNIVVNNDAETVSADDLEEAIYSKPEISVKEKFDLLQQTTSIERVHTYQGFVVYGHRIGRFMTDFAPIKDEAKLYFALKFLAHATFCRYLYILQKCIDNDSRNILASLYDIPNTATGLTSVFLDDVDQNLTDGAKLQKIFDIYEEEINEC